MRRRYADWEAEKGMGKKTGINREKNRDHYQNNDGDNSMGCFRSRWQSRVWGGKKEILCCVAALACFLLLFAGTYQSVQQEQGAISYDIVVLGDSILGQYRDETSIPSKIESLLGKPVFNGALGGTCMGRQDGEMRLGYTKDCLSVSALAEAIAAKDFGVQQTIRSRENATEYFDSTIDELSRVDFDQVELLLIGGGVNDYHAGIPIYPEDEEGGAYDEYTFVGALRSVIRDIRKAYPHIRIILVSPTYTWYREKSMTCEEYNLGGGFLEQYVEAERQVAGELEVEFIDLYHDFYPNENWEDWERYTIDGLHPNEEGRALIAEKIAATVQP